IDPTVSLCLRVSVDTKAQRFKGTRAQQRKEPSRHFLSMIVKDAYRFLLPLLATALLALGLRLYWVAILVLLLVAFVAFFFRNPRREVPSDPRVIVSPADGRVVKVERVGNVTRLSIFLSIFNVHVNRSPIAGRIEAIDYRRGKFKAAFNHAASVE